MNTARLLALCFVLLLALPAGAQTTGSLFGSVTDQTGAMVPGAKIQAVNTATGEVRTTESNQSGAYSLPALPVGLWNLRCEMGGFKSWVQEGIELTVNRNARADVRLEIGAIAQETVVVEDAPMVETSSSQVSALVDQRRVVELPINTRNTLTLINLIPGAGQLQNTNNQGFVENNVSVNGMRPQDSNWTLDGGDNTSTLRNGGNDVPNPDAIQEFRVIANNYDAEYGRSGGAIVNVITRSGTNQFHGSAFEFLRNRSLNARNFFEADTTPLVQNQYGGTFGGPVVKQKTFFFGSWQSLKRRTADSTALHNAAAMVPTAAERAGDFSNSFDRNGRRVSVLDPISRQPFPNNIVPASRLDPVAVNYLKAAIPLPNNPALGPNSIYQSVSLPNNNGQFLVKLDHQLSTNHKLSGAYFWSDTVDGQRFQSVDIDFVRRDIQSRQQNLNIHEYWMISANKLNHFRATFSRSTGNRHVTPDDLTLVDLGSNFSPLPEGPHMPPSLQVSGYFNAGSTNGGPKHANHYNVADGFDWIHGRHNLKFGAEGWLRKMNDISTKPQMGGGITIDGTLTGGYGFADLMLGQVRTFRVARQTYKSNNAWAFYWFAQDKVRLTPKLSLNLGVRYEMDTWPVMPTNELIAWMPGRQSKCVPQSPVGVVFPCDDGVPRAGAFNDRNNFAPRVGLAYDLTGNGKTILRAGYGVSYAFTMYNVLQEQQISIPFSYDRSITNTTLSDPYRPIGGSPFPFRTDPANLTFAPGAIYSFQDLHTRNGYVQQWDFTIQRQLGSAWSVEAAYVGNTARKLPGMYDINAPLRTANATSGNYDQRRPLYPAITTLRQSGGFTNSFYNALQIRAERRFQHGFSLMASYTAGKAIDDSSAFDSRDQWVDTRNRALDRGLSANHVPQAAVLSWVWQLPIRAPQQRIVKALAEGWSLNGIASFYAGQPIYVVTARDNDYDGNANNDRPDAVGSWYLSPNRARGDVVTAWFNPQAIVSNALGQIGNLGRNVVMGPGTKNIDVGIFKSFRIGEGRQLQFRAESFNMANWTNLTTVERRATSPNFGKVTAASTPRIFQLGLKLAF